MTETAKSRALPEADDLQINAYFDGELETEARAAFERRLSEEPQLRAALDRLEALRTAIGGRASIGSASDALRDRIARIGTPQATAPARRRAGFDWRMLAATAVIAAATGSFATQMLSERPARFAASASVVAAHQHALLEANPVEVASSDRHTVKPWFDAKLAISPPVADLAGDDFPLVGGRIATVDGRRVPVLIYRHRAHLVSVIADPAAGGSDQGAAPTRTTRDGYTVLTWRGPDFRFSAVSDVTEGDLAGFVEKLRRAMRAS